MPGGDRTGPTGMGPRTGRAMGYCAGFGQPGFLSGPAMAGWSGRGFFGRGRGGGRGWRNWFYATGLTGWQRAARAAGTVATAPPVAPSASAAAGAPESAPTELELLRQHAEFLAASLEQVQQRIDALGQQAAGEES